MAVLPLFTEASTATAPAHASPPEALRGCASAIDALYFHVPFCTTKCHYCDFYSLAGHLDQADAYLAAFGRELELQRAFFGRPKPATIFIGGGTPTLLAPAALVRFLTLLTGSIDASALREFTIEANPNTFSAEKAVILKGFGINRISFGAQSFNPGELRMLQRDHDPESIAPAFAAARGAGIHNLSLDLIFGIPGQTLESWEHSLARALEQEPSHMSCYSLTYEPTTAMTARLARGEFTAIDEELELAMFDHVYARLREAGFVRYEISNYARQREGALAQICQHNLAYWKGLNWLAFGPSAGAHVALPQAGASSSSSPVAWQWKNVGSLAHYLDALSPPNTRLPLTQLENLSQHKWAAGVAVFWMRLAEGIDYREFAVRTGVEPEFVLRGALARYVDLGLAECTTTSARILEAGVAVSNRMLADILAAFENLRG